MMEQAITELYRTQEDKTNYDFVSCVTITYFGDTAFIQGLSTSGFTIRCYKEIVDYLENKGMRQMQYFRKDRLKIIDLDSEL